MSHSRKLAAFLPLVLVFNLGCGSKPTPKPIVEKKEGDNLSHIVGAYEEANKKLGRPPQSADEIKPYLETYGDPERLLISPNDKLPYVILWGVDLLNKKAQGEYLTSPILAHEAKGKTGIRQCIDIFGSLQSLDDAGFAKITFAPGTVGN